MKISIILPVYNGEGLLQETLAQIAKQRFKDFDVIIINDGSTDATEKITVAFCENDSRFKVFHQPNAGVASARDKGLKMASGEYIIHHDVDDYMPLDALKNLYEAIVQNNADIAIGDYKVVRGKTSNAVKQSFQGNSDDLIQGLLDGKFHGALWNKLIKRSLYEGVQFEEGINYMEDKLILIRILFKNPKLTYVPHVVYHYIMDENSLSNNLSDDSFQMIKKVIEHLENDFKVRNLNFELTKIKLGYRLGAILRDKKLNHKEVFKEVNNQILRTKNLKVQHKYLLFFESLGVTFFSKIYRKLSWN
ncbi:MAG: glycosyltransferase family 2 protein [Aequorivita sp.]